MSVFSTVCPYFHLRYIYTSSRVKCNLFYNHNLPVSLLVSCYRGHQCLVSVAAILHQSLNHNSYEYFQNHNCKSTSYSTSTFEINLVYKQFSNTCNIHTDLDPCFLYFLYFLSKTAVLNLLFSGGALIHWGEGL